MTVAMGTPTLNGRTRPNGTKGKGGVVSPPSPSRTAKQANGLTLLNNKAGKGHVQPKHDMKDSGGVAEAGIAQEEIERESWELRTETVEDDFAGEDSGSLQELQREHARQITHYRNLLVRAQSASSSSIHDLHMQLQALQERHNSLQAEHARCSALAAEGELAIDRTEDVFGGSSHVRVSSADGTARDWDIRGRMRRLDRVGRMHALQQVLEACHPSDIQSQIALLQKYKRSRIDIIGKSPEEVQTRILRYLDVPDTLSVRLVSRGYEAATRLAPLWRSLCRNLDARLSQRRSGPDREEDGGVWERLYRGLHARERNWSKGEAQSVRVMTGHTNYVTSLSLKGELLISGSYDESVRIWHMPYQTDMKERQSTCQQIIPAKAVSYLDYCPDSGVLAAGFHDTGRIQVWRREGGGAFELLHTLNGHLHGIRAVAINRDHIVSAGADKALVVWHWPSGEKVVKFGQQTNICLGVTVVEDLIISMTVDGIIRVFSISKRDLVAQYKVDDILKAQGHGHMVGGGMMSWFSGRRGEIACGNKDGVYKLRWPEHECLVPITTPLLTPASPATKTTSHAAAVPVTPPVRSRTKSLAPSAASRPPHTPQTPQRLQSSPTATDSASPLARRRTIPRKPSLPVFTPKKKTTPPSREGRRIFQPDVGRPPALVAVYQLYVIGKSPEVVPIRGEWAAEGDNSLTIAAKNPMSLVADEEKVIYGCADGSIVVVGFV